MNVSTAPMASSAPLEPALERRYSPLTAAAERRQGTPGRSAARGWRGFPGSASTLSTPSAISRFTPVTTHAHDTPRAIRVRRSPR